MQKEEDFIFFGRTQLSDMFKQNQTPVENRYFYLTLREIFDELQEFMDKKISQFQNLPYLKTTAANTE